MNDFKNDYPAGFRVLNSKLEDTLYLENKAEDGVLEISNITEKPIHFVRREDVYHAGQTNYHFAVRFRPGILKVDKKNFHQDKLIKHGWHLTVAKEAVSETIHDEYFVVFYFLHVGTGMIKQNEKLYLPLKNLQLDCEEGTQLTQVELTLNNITHEVNSKQTIITHSRHYNLPIVNHRGSPVMPLHIGFTNFNALLNDGKTPHELTLLIDNFQHRTPEKDGLFRFSVKKRSRMYIYFDVDEEDEDWSLNTPENVSNIELIPWVAPGTGSFTKVVYREGAMPVWELFPETEDVVLQPHMTQALSSAANISDAAFMEIKFNGIVAGTTGGITKLYLRFENIPGYWDQTFAVPIVKQPMVFDGQNVGIGTDKPVHKLDVRGDVRATTLLANKIGVGTPTPDMPLDVTGNARVKRLVAEQVAINMGTETPGFTLEVLGQISLRRADESQHMFFLHDGEKAAITAGGVSKGMALLLSDKQLPVERQDYKEMLRVLPNGKVGIGTTEPQATLDVAGDLKVKNLYVVQEGVAKVGINTNEPRAPLHVCGGQTHMSFENGYVYGVNGPSAELLPPPGEWGSPNWIPIISVSNISIFSEGAIATKEGLHCHSSWFMSDARIKEVTGNANNALDLLLLRKIGVTLYRYIDNRLYGNRIHRKVIAQDLEKIFPQSVGRRKDTIPSIYKPAQCNYNNDLKQLRLLIEVGEELQAGDTIELISDGDVRNRHKVLNVQTDSVTVSSDTAYEKVFVYGKEVDDFRYVDYDEIFMLNVSATQELATKTDKLIEENKLLREEVNTMRHQYEQMKSDIEMLKNALLMKATALS